MVEHIERGRRDAVEEGRRKGLEAAAITPEQITRAYLRRILRDAKITNPKGTLTPLVAIPIRSKDESDKVQEALFDYGIYPAGTDEKLFIFRSEDFEKAASAQLFAENDTFRRIDFKRFQKEQRERPKLNESDIALLGNKKTQEKLLQILEDPEAEFMSVVDAMARFEKVPNNEAFYNSTYVWIRRKFGSYYKGGREELRAFLEQIDKDPANLYPRQNPKKVKPEIIPKYGSLPHLSEEYLKRIQRPDRLEHPEDYTGTEGGMKFLRYYGLHRRKYEKDTALFTRKFDEEFGGAVPQVVNRRMPEDLRGVITMTGLTLKDAKRLRAEVWSADDSYNTEDGFIRWLLDHDYKNIDLPAAFSAVPRKVKERMTDWRQMSFTLEKTIEVRSALENIDDSYNTPDGLTRWMEDNFPDLHPHLLRTVIPDEVKERMSEWHMLAMGRYDDAPEIAEKFMQALGRRTDTDYPEKYRGTEGGILFLRYYSRFRRSNRFFSPRYLFERELPEKLKEQIRTPDVPYKDILEMRRRLTTVDDSYNTEDGQIRWLLDNGLSHVTLDKLWTVIPQKIRERMTKWRRMVMNPNKTQEIRHKLESIDSSYNTADGQIRWLEDSGFTDTSPALFWKVIPMNVRVRMTEWRQLPYTLADAKDFIKRGARIRETLRQKYILDDSSAENRIITFLLRTKLSQREVNKVLSDSFKNADALMNELALARVINPNQESFSIRNAHQLYDFAHKRFDLSPASVWVILSARSTI